MAAITSTASGNWSAGGTWVGGVAPTTGDTVTIAAGHTVDIDQNITVGTDVANNVAIAISGILRVNNPAASYTLNAYGFVDINNGGEYKVDMSTQPTYTYTHKFNCTAVLGKNKYFTRIKSGGKLTIDGANKTRHFDVSTAGGTSGTSTITTANDNSTNWQVGDKLIFLTKGGSVGLEETRTISSFGASGLINLSSNLTNTHAAGTYVINMTRNVQFVNFSSSSSNLSINVNVQSGFSSASHIYWAQMEGGSDTNYNHAVLYSQGNGLPELQYVAFNNVQNNALSFDSTVSTRVYVTNCAFVYASGATTRAHILNNVNVSNSGSVSIDLSGCFFCSNKPVFNLNAGTIQQMSVSSCVGAINTFNTNQAAGVAVNNSTFSGNTWIGNAYNMVAWFNNTFSNEYHGNATTAMSLNNSANNSWNGVTFSSNTTDIALDGYTDNYMYNLSNDPTVTVASTTFLGMKLRLEKLSNTEGTHRTYTKYGNYTKQGTTKRSGSYALQVNPKNATNVVSAVSNIPVKANIQVVVSAWLQKNSSYGTTNLPSMVLSGLDVTGTLTATMTDVNDTWQLLTVSGVTTIDGFLQVSFNGQSSTTGAAFFVDDVLMVYTAIDTGSMEYFNKGDLPPLLMATALGATDVWAVTASSANNANSIGEQLNNALTLPLYIGLK